MSKTVDLWKSLRDMERKKLRDQLNSIYDRVVKAEDELSETRQKLNEYNKDEHVAKLLEENANLRAQIYSAFSITTDENELIKVWKHQHIEEKHNGDSYAGAIGGMFSYVFTPTSIGVVGEIQCHCGDKFCFKDLD